MFESTLLYWTSIVFHRGLTCLEFFNDILVPKFGFLSVVSELFSLNWHVSLGIDVLDADMEDYGFEYSGEELKYRIENYYFNSKGYVSLDLCVLLCFMC